MTITDVRGRRASWRPDRGDAWVVESLCMAGGVAHVDQTSAGLHLRVCDDRDQPGCGTEAWLLEDGRVAVRCAAAPPALLVTQGASRLVPSLPGGRDTQALVDGDLLVMCSAGALDHLPAGIGAVLGWGPRQLGASHPETLLERLMAEVDEGAALLARYRAPTADVTRHAH